MPPTLSPASAAAIAWDVIIVGAGPAGGMCALLLARCGRRVLLVDRAAFPREKACGCCLNSTAIGVLREEGLSSILQAAAPLERLALKSAAQRADFYLPPSAAISRGELDSAIVGHAIAAGAHFLPECSASVPGSWGSGFQPDCLPRGGDQAGSPTVDQDGRPPRATLTRPVILHHAKQTFTAQTSLILACDGLSGSLWRDDEAAAWDIAPDAWIGAACTLPEGHFPVATRTIAMHLGKGGYVGAVQLPSGQTHLAGALDPAACHAAGGAIKLMQDILGGTDILVCHPHLLGTAPLTRRRRRLGGHRLMVVGDSAGYVEPFTGEGIAWALKSAQAMVNLLPASLEDIAPDMVDRWTAAHHRLLSIRHQRCRAARFILHRPMLAELAMMAAKVVAASSPL